MILFVNLVAVTCISAASVGYLTRPLGLLIRLVLLVLGISLAFSYAIDLDLRAIAAVLISLGITLDAVFSAKTSVKANQTATK